MHLPFVVVTVLTGIFAIHFLVMELAVPLWLATRTSAPKWLVAVVLLINTVAVALFQVRLSRGSGSVLPAARTLLVGAVWVAGGFALIAFSSDQPVWLAVVLVCGGAAVHVVGEMVGSGGQWGAADGPGAAGAAGAVPGLRGDELLAVEHRRAAADHPALHRVGTAGLVRPRRDHPGRGRPQHPRRRVGAAHP